MITLKEQDWLKIINEAYVHPYGHQLLCNYDWQTRLVVTKIFQIFQSGNYIAYTVLAECPVCKKTYISFLFSKHVYKMNEGIIWTA